MSFERIMTIGGTGLNAQLVRMNATASNLANVGVVSGTAETAFRAQRPVFAALLQGETAGGFQNLAGGVRVDRACGGLHGLRHLDLRREDGQPGVRNPIRRCTLITDCLLNPLSSTAARTSRASTPATPARR